jgi:hypothetical protein
VSTKSGNERSLGRLSTGVYADSLDCPSCGFRVKYTGGDNDGCDIGQTRNVEVRYVCSEFYDLDLAG